MKIDMTGVTSAGTFAPLEKGRYPFAIKEAKEGETPKGFPKVSLTLEEISSKKRVFHDLVMTVNSRPFTKHFLECIGQPSEGIIDIYPHLWTGIILEAEVDLEEYPKKDGTKGIKNVVSQFFAHKSEAKQDIEETNCPI